MTRRKLYLIQAVGFALLLTSIYIGHLGFFAGEAADGVRLPNLLTLMIGSFLGLSFIRYEQVVKKDYYFFPFVTFILLFLLVSLFEHQYRSYVLINEGVEMEVTVNFAGDIGRFYEFHYTYEVDGEVFKKIDTDSDHEIQYGDTLTLTYWSENPHFHKTDRK